MKREWENILESVREPAHPNAFQRISSSTPETNESHLVRDQNRLAVGVGAPNQELQDCLALPPPSEVSHCHPATYPQVTFSNGLFRFQQCVTVQRRTDGSNFQKSPTKNSLSVPRNCEEHFTYRGSCFELRTVDDGFSLSFDVTFNSEVTWWTHDSSLVNIQNRNSLSSSW
ncbi:hypothetical protein TNCV_2700261 [Trichonephila clavipes]|nr:hypothetical protein TNCV_2700261 [Trichonephila clavipes]